MKRLLVASAALLALAVFAAPSAQAQTCFAFCDFCDGLELTVSGQQIDGTWQNTDCLGTDVDIEGAMSAGNIPNACAGGMGDAVVDCSSIGQENCTVAGLEWFFVIDAPLDGTIDMNSGNPLGSFSCWIDDVCYTQSLGACPFGPRTGPASTE